MAGSKIKHHSMQDDIADLKTDENVPSQRELTVLDELGCGVSRIEFEPLPPVLKKPGATMRAPPKVDFSLPPETVARHTIDQSPPPLPAQQKRQATFLGLAYENIMTVGMATCVFYLTSSGFVTGFLNRFIANRMVVYLTTGVIFAVAMVGLQLL